MSFWEEIRAWSKYLRDNFGVILLTVILTGFVFLIIHISHDKANDGNLMAWTTTQATGIIGALLYALTGREKDKSQNRADDQHMGGKIMDVHVETTDPDPANFKKEVKDAVGASDTRPK